MSGWERRPASAIQMGNGALLATFDAVGELEQVYAPSIDALQSRLGSFRNSLVFPAAQPGEVPEWSRISPEEFHVRLRLEAGSQVLLAEYHHKHRPVRVHRRIGLHPTEPVLLDHWRILDERAGVLHESVPWMGGSTSAHCSLYHPALNGLVHHRGRRWLGVLARAATHWTRVGHLSDQDTHRLWAGERVWPPVAREELRGYPGAPLRLGWDQVVQGTPTWGALAVAPAEEIEFFILCAESERHLGGLLELLKDVPARRYFEMIENYARRRHLPAGPLLARVGSPKVRALCERSIDVLHALQDARSGALLAAAEVDPHSKMSGGYGYSWPRDGAYLGSALDAWGFHDRVERYFQFLCETQDSSGAWWQRYLATGHAGPSWGRIQIDEPATVIVAAYWHFQATRDLFWLERIWAMLEKGLGFLERFHSHEHPMGQPSHDLWEERMGLHAYSLGAVARAFLAGAYLARQLSRRPEQRRYFHQAGRIQKLLRANFLLHEGAYRRAFIVNTWDYERGGGSFDEKADVSLLGLIHPFRVLQPDDPCAGRILEDIRSKLWVKPVGGFMRYEWDAYRGGNPWILTTLWMASLELKLGRIEAAREAFRWVLSKATPLGMLAEQVHRESGEPFWVIPLGWSHAMFLLFVREALESRREGEIWEGL